MAKMMERIKNFFNGTVLIKTKRSVKKEETEPTEKVSSQQGQEEQKQQSST